jgi:nucleoid-associated protein YgaU
MPNLIKKNRHGLKEAKDMEIDFLAHGPYGPSDSLLAQYERQHASAVSIESQDAQGTKVWAWVFFLLLPLAFLASMWVSNTTQQKALVSTPQASQEAVVVVPEANNSNIVASEEITTITVRKGDTLWALVGPNWPTVCQANRLANCNLIFPGQELRLPARNARRSE